MFENQESTESFNKEVFRGIKTLFYFEHFSEHSVCSMHNFHEAMLKDVNENLPLKLESSFAFSWGQIVTWISN